ncbi:MAG: hypothetical protein ABIR11_00840 [Candidatus Limnocylindrales bacterium]
MTTFSFPLLFFLPLLVAVVMLVAAGIAAVRRSRSVTFDEERYPGLAALRRVTLRTRHLGIAASVAVFFVVGSLGRYGSGLFVAPAAAGAVVIAAILVGQQLRYTRARTAGTAGIEQRRVSDYLPTRTTTIAVAALIILAVIAAWTTLVATPDEVGLDRTFTHSCVVQLWDEQGDHEQIVVGTSSPFPGRYYTVGMAVALLAVLVLAWAGLVATTRRPRNGADPELVRVDDALRRQTAEGIVAAFGLAVATSLAGLSYTAAIAVGNEACTTAYGLGSWGLAIVAFVALAVSLRFAVIVLVPGDGSSRRPS